MIITKDLARKLVARQFPEYAHLEVIDVEKQGHDNRTYRLGDAMLIRMPTDVSYALKVPKEQELLPQLAPHLSLSIPVPIKMGIATQEFPYPFSIYKWLPGRSINLTTLNTDETEQLALDLAKFLKELHSITEIDGPPPGAHNFWRGDHVSVYDEGARTQISELHGIIDSDKLLDLWERACKTKWTGLPLWIHGDLAIGNMLIVDGKLSSVIDFGGAAKGDPACDLVIAWTYFEAKAREVFINQMALDGDTWLRAKAWVLWKATFQLCEIPDKGSLPALQQIKIIYDAICT